MARWTFTRGRRSDENTLVGVEPWPPARKHVLGPLRASAGPFAPTGSQPTPFLGVKTSRPWCVTGVPSWPPAVALRPARAAPWQAHKLLSGQGPLFVSSSAHRALTNQGGMGRPRSGRAGSRRGVSPLRRRLGRNRPNFARFLGVLSLRLEKKVIKVKTVRRRVRGSKSCAKSLIFRRFVIHNRPQKSCFRTSRVEIPSLRSRESVPQKSCSRTSEVVIIHRLTHRFCG